MKLCEANQNYSSQKQLWIMSSEMEVAPPGWMDLSLISQTQTRTKTKTQARFYFLQTQFKKIKSWFVGSYSS